MTDRERRYPTEDEIAAIKHASDNTCCKCRQPRLPLQLHHIDEDRSNADPDNFALLCANCHNETMISGPFARKLDPATVRAYRDEWHSIVRTRRERAADTAPSEPSLRDAVIREMRRGRTIEGRIGPWYQPTMQDEIGRWEADVAYLFDSTGRTDLSRRFLWNPPLDLPAMFDTGEDAALRRRMKRRLGALDGFLSEGL
jgi:hypothetical protein